jgi:site-specific DNA recombinase
LIQPQSHPQRQADLGHSTLCRLLRNEAYIGRVYFNRTETVPDKHPTKRTRQVPRAREDWITIEVPRIVIDEIFQAAGRISIDNSKWSPRRAEPGEWLLRGLVRCGNLRSGHQLSQDARPKRHLASVLLCRNHDPIRAGGEGLRCRERNIRADALDRFVFDQIKDVLLHPDLLVSGERAVTVSTPIPDDELLAAELARLDRKIDAAEAERRRLVDIYQAGLIELTDL